MVPKLIEGEWYIEVATDDFGKVLLLEKGDLPIPVKFNKKEDALDYISNYVSTERED